jgi:TRAP-type C4-dicarboxylate transport system permease small subunit
MHGSKKTDFKLKKYILYDFNDDPHIPIRMIYHQLLSYLYLLFGFVLWIILYILYANNHITAEDPARYVLLFATYYSLGVGGLLLFVMMLLRGIDLLKYRGEYFVDSKWIK